MFKSFRLQLTAWYLLFFTLLLAGFSAFLYVLLSRNLHDRLDASLASAARAAADLFLSELAEHNGNAPAAAAEALQELRLPHTFLAVFEGGRLLAASDPRISTAGTLTARAKGAALFATLPDGGVHGARVIVLPFRAGGRGCSLAAMEPLDSVAEQLASLRHVLYLALPAALLLAGLGGFLLATKSLAPIVAMAEQAELITAQNLHQRLEVGPAKQEFERLARALNELLARLDRSFESMREFMADASHELRTPLAVIRGEADVALSQNRPPAEYREALGIVQDEARRLSRLVDDLLNLARADAGHRPLDRAEFYLNDLLEDCCRSAQVLARRKELQFTCESSTDIPFCGDQKLLRRLVLNLLDNAIRYTPAGKSVSVKLDTEGANARIVVADTGVGIPPECADRVFERFYRVDKARSRADGGFGLGLSIVKWIAESHQGTVHLSSRPESGSTFTVLLPLRGLRAPLHTEARVLNQPGRFP